MSIFVLPGCLISILCMIVTRAPNFWLQSYRYLWFRAKIKHGLILQSAEIAQLFMLFWRNQYVHCWFYLLFLLYEKLLWRKMRIVSCYIFTCIWASELNGCFQLPDVLCSTGNCESGPWCSPVLVNFRQIQSTKVVSPEIKDLIYKDLLCPRCSSAKSGRRRCVCMGGMWDSHCF